MFKFIRNLFRPTIDSIISDINAKVARLHAVAELHDLERQAQSKIAIEAQKASAYAAQEYGRAKTIAAKLAGLVS